MRKLPLFTEHVRLISEYDFCVAQATLGPLKLTHPGRIDHWSFPNFAMCACQDAPVRPELRTCICLTDHETSPPLPR